MAAPTASPILHNLDLANRLRALLRALRGVMAFEDGGLLLYEPEQGVLVPYAVLGAVEAARPGEGAAGQAAERRAVVWEHEGTCWQVGLPVAYQETLYGALVFGACRTAPPTDAQIALLEHQAEQIAVELHVLRHVRSLERLHAVQAAALQGELGKIRLLHRIANVGAAPQGESLDELAAVMRETAGLLHCDWACLLLPDHEGYRLVVQETTGPAAQEPYTGLSWALDGPGAPVDAYHTGTARVAGEDELAGAGYAHALACPLNARRRTLGVLYVVRYRPEPFDPDAIALAQSIADQIALSAVTGHFLRTEVRRADLINQVNRVSRELYATLDVQGLLRKLAQRMLQVFEHDAVYILLLSDDRQTLRLRAAATATPGLILDSDLVIPAAAGVVGRTVQTGQTQIVPDIRTDPDFLHLPELRGLQSCLAIPLRRGDETIGVISVLSTRLNAFSDTERDAMETLARQISIALENAHLYDQAQHRLLEQEIVHQIGQDLASILDYGELAQAMVQHMNRALNTSSCVVGLYVPELNAVRISAAYRDPDHPSPHATPASGRILALSARPALERAIRTRAPVIVYRDAVDSAPDAQALLDQWGVQSQLVLPMVAGERVIGVVDWTDHQPNRVFTPSDIRLAQTLVGQATIAFDNALLFQQLESRAQELAQANRLKSQFLATISHELRTPMNSIIGFSDALLSNLYGPLNEAQTNRVHRIRRNAQHLLHLIDDLLDLSKIDAGRMTLSPSLISVSDLVRDVVQEMEPQAQARRLALVADLPADLPPVCVDAQRLQQVIRNLLSNAIKFTPEGHITVSAQALHEARQSCLAITVADTGIGIAEADQTIIFDEFRQADGSSTRAYDGTGLGLAISKRLIEMMGGSIQVESAPGEGSRFTVSLPLTEQVC